MLKTGNNINVTGDKGQSVDMDKETEVNQFHLQLHFTAIDRETTKSLQLFHMGILTKVYYLRCHILYHNYVYVYVYSVCIHTVIHT